MKAETKEAIGNMASLADLVAEARATVRVCVTVGRPEGGITVKEYAAGPPRIGITTAREQLKKAVAAGMMEVMQAIVSDSDGMPRAMKFYRKVSNAKVDRI